MVRACVLTTLALASVACSGTPSDGTRISLRGSDTMVILVQRWAERYAADHPGASVEVAGGGSAVGMAALLNGTADVVAMSRPMTEREQRNLHRERSVDPHAVRVALDAVSIYVHRDNPVQSLSIEQLAAIYTGEARSWAAFGGPDARIVLYSRESSSGTYGYFKERVLGGRDFARRTQTLPGTAAVVNAVNRDPNGIGYGGVAYARGVRTVPLMHAGAAVSPSLVDTSEGRYPLARYLYLVTAGEPRGLAAEVIDWVRSEEGQRLVSDVGYFPLPDDPEARALAGIP